MINDHAIQSFKKVVETHIQRQSLLGETINLHVMLTIYMFEDHMWGKLHHSNYVITPMTQRWDIKRCESVEPRDNDKRVTKNRVHG